MKTNLFNRTIWFSGALTAEDLESAQDDIVSIQKKYPYEMVVVLLQSSHLEADFEIAVAFFNFVVEHGFRLQTGVFGSLSSGIMPILLAGSVRKSGKGVKVHLSSDEETMLSEIVSERCNIASHDFLRWVRRNRQSPAGLKFLNIIHEIL